MVERNRWHNLVAHLVLCVGVLIIVFPIYLAFVGATHSSQDMAQSPIPIWFGPEGLTNIKTVFIGEESGSSNLLPVSQMMWVSFISAVCIAFGKITISLLSAFAIVYFQFPFRKTVFWGIFITLMLPITDCP